MSREKQIEELVEVISKVPPIEFPFGSRLRGKRIFALNHIAKHIYEAGYRKQEWISVDERLPKQWEMVLVCCDDIISTDFISSSGKWYEHIDHNSVTHWMPLPEPPKTKGGEE